MAIKDKNRESKNKVSNIISNEYKWTNIILCVVATISAAFAMIIIVGEVTISSSVPVLGEFPLVFAWILFAIAIFGLGLVVWPFVRSALPEFLRISWPKGRDFRINTIRVFFFMIVMAFILLFFEYIVVTAQQGLM